LGHDGTGNRMLNVPARQKAETGWICPYLLPSGARC
jgi:hypothetical protein